MKVEAQLLLLMVRPAPEALNSGKLGGFGCFRDLRFWGFGGFMVYRGLGIKFEGFWV